MFESDRRRHLALFVAARGLEDVELVGSGLEFVVYRALDPVRGPVAVRVARQRHFRNANDPHVASRALLEQEFSLTRTLSERGFPVARAHELVLGDVDLLISELVEPDGTGFSSGEAGRLLATLHALAPPPDLPVANGGLAAEEQVRQRLIRRWGELQRRVPHLTEPPPEDVLRQALACASPRSRPSLLHLDVRAANLARRHGRVVAFLDWSNAMVGPPLLELARAAEFARLPENELDMPALRRGYAEVAALPDDPAAETVYRLDAALMLALVFTAEAPDQGRAAASVGRVRVLREHVHPR